MKIELSKVELSPTERRALKARAHGLDPVVMIGNEGLTPSVLREVDRSLKAHELVKIRASVDERDVRETWCLQICRLLGAQEVQHIGKMLVVWRLNPEKEKARKRKAAPPVVRKAPRVTKREEEQKASRRRTPRS